MQILAGVRRSIPRRNGTAQFSVSHTGSLVYVRGPANATTNLRSLVLSDRNGLRVPLKVPPGNYAHPRVSRDGDGRCRRRRWSGLQRLDIRARRHQRDAAADAGGTEPASGLVSRWQRLAFQSDREGDLGIFSQRADGGGMAERLTTAPQGTAHLPESWSPDGKHLLFTEQKGPVFTCSTCRLTTRRARRLAM